MLPKEVKIIEKGEFWGQNGESVKGAPDQLNRSGNPSTDWSRDAKSFSLAAALHSQSRGDLSQSRSNQAQMVTYHAFDG